MKKKMITAVMASLIAMTTANTEIHAQSLTSLKRQVATYEAVAMKDVKGIDKDTWKNVKYAKGKKITIVERKYIEGYDYIITKGNVYFQFDNSAFKVIKTLPGKTDYSKYKMSQDLKNELSYIGTTHRYYDRYQAAAIRYEKQHQNTVDFLFRDYLASTLQKQIIIPGGIESSPTLSFDNWLEYGKPTYYQQPSECMPESKYRFDIMSSKFINKYMYTNNRTVVNIKKNSHIQNYNACSKFGTGVNDTYKYGAVGYSIKSNYLVKDVYVFPIKKYTYNQVISKLGKPTTTKYITKGVHEYQAIYNANPRNGFKVIVGFDQYKGDLKYMVKVDE